MEYAIGIDLGGTSIKYALVDEEGHTCHYGKVPSLASTSAQNVIDQLIRVAREVKTKAEDCHIQIKGIGVGTPGILDETNRIVVGGAENIVGWEHIDVAQQMEKALGVNVVLGNDANMMGLGETRFGAAKGCSDVVFVTIGTGIGGAVIIDGKLFGGYANRGTELGHIPLMADGEQCACGAIGCFEHYASTGALVRQFTQLAHEKGFVPDRVVDGEYIVELYKANNDLAVACLKRHFYYVGRGIAGLINIFSPQRVVLGGGLPEAGSFYMEGVKENVRQHVIADCAVHTQLVAAKLGNMAGLIGASSLVL